MNNESKYKPLTGNVSAILLKGRESLFKRQITMWLSNFGEVEHVEISAESSKILLSITLKGEETPTHIAIYEYSVLKTHGHYTFKFEEIKTSKLWMNILIKKYIEHVFPDKEIQLARNITTNIYFSFL